MVTKDILRKLDSPWSRCCTALRSKLFLQCEGRDAGESLCQFDDEHDGRVQGKEVTKKTQSVKQRISTSGYSIIWCSQP